MITPKFCYQSSNSDCSYIYIKDITEDYGTPNVDKSSLHIIVKANYYDSVEYLPFTEDDDIYSIAISKDGLINIEILYVYNKGVVTPTLNQYVYDVTNDVIQKVITTSPLAYENVTDLSVLTTTNTYANYVFSKPLINDCKARKCKWDTLFKYFEICSCEEKKKLMVKLKEYSILSEGIKANYKIGNYDIAHKMLVSCNKSNCNCGCK